MWDTNQNYVGYKPELSGIQTRSMWDTNQNYVVCKQELSGIQTKNIRDTNQNYMGYKPELCGIQTRTVWDTNQNCVGYKPELCGIQTKISRIQSRTVWNTNQNYLGYKPELPISQILHLKQLLSFSICMPIQCHSLNIPISLNINFMPVRHWEVLPLKKFFVVTIFKRNFKNFKGF
jgi:hypothetical protein